jgi:hypothetical protein
MNKPHRHKDIIVAWANGTLIQWRLDDSYEWQDLEKNTPPTDVIREYRIKPEREYPKSSLSDDELCNLIEFTRSLKPIHTARHIADAAVKKYIQENEE